MGGQNARFHFLAATAILFLSLLGNNVPTPLYPLWQVEYDLSSTATTAIYAIYPAGTIAALLFGGKLADQLGRRPVMLAAALIGALGAFVMMVSTTLIPLMSGRFLNGLAIGLVSGPAVAAMVELEPRHDHARASWLAALFTAFSGATGTLGATLLVRYLPLAHALVVPFLLQFLFFFLVALLILRQPETLGREWLRHWREVDYAPRTARIPPAIRDEFLFAASAAFVVWAITSLWFALGPAMVISSLGNSHLLHGSLGASVMLATSGLVQIVLGRLPDRASIFVGLALAILSNALIALFLISAAFPALYISAFLSGLAQGLTWLGCAKLINRISPVEQRAETISALYVVVYGSSVAIIGVGSGTDRIGLTASVMMLLLLLSLISLWSLFLGYRSRTKS